MKKTAKRKIDRARKSSYPKSSRLPYVLVGLAAAVLLLPFVFRNPEFLNTNPEWIEPERIESTDGLLDTELIAEKSLVQIGNTATESAVYNKSYPGQMFVVSPGDQFRVKVTNNIDQPTNLHFHGSHVSPKGNSDNVLNTISPGESFQHVYNIPQDHPPGLYWYHPHFHGYTESQVASGMVGAIIVKGDIDELPGIKGLPEKVLVLTTQDTSDDNAPVRLVNGKQDPTLYIRPFEVQRWRIVNASADDFYNFAINGRKLHIISRDGNTLSTVTSVESELMSPGDRIEILVKGPGWGTHAVKSLPFDQGHSKYVEDTFMTLKSSGLPVTPRSLPRTLIPFKDLSDVPVNNTRVLTFSMKDSSGDRPTFLIDNEEFDMDRIDQVLTLNDTDEWIIKNETDEWHPFHIHINPFQVIEINGQPVERNGYDDTFAVPARGSIKLKTHYKDFDGIFVLHCHILFHEDNGMMQIVEILNRENPESSREQYEQLNMEEHPEMHH